MPPVQEVKAPNRRLDSWKEIAAFFGRDERTVKRWEKERALPIHRLPGGLRARVFAFTEELDRWMHSLELPPGEASPAEALDPAQASPEIPPENPELEAAAPAPSKPGRSKKPWFIAAVVGLLVIAAVTPLAIRRHRLAVEASTGATPTHTPAPGAQELYLQGRYYWNKRTPADLNKAVDYFTQAIVHDPNYAAAYVGLADSYNLLREFAAMPEQEAYPRALSAAKKAVELDDSSAEAHTSLAFVELYWNWDVPAAERDFRRAIKLNPDYATAHHWYANFLGMAGRRPEALEEINRAQQLDPGSNAIVADRALVLFGMGRADEALAILKGMESSQPGFFSSHRYLSYIYFSRRDFSNYLAESTKAAQVTQDQTQLEIARAADAGYRSGGERGMFEALLKVDEKLYQSGQLSPYMLAVSHARLNHNDEALLYLQKAYELHDPIFLNIRGDGSFVALRNDPRFRQLERKSGLPPLT